MASSFGYPGPLDEALVEPLARCTGTTPECPHTECPDDWHYGIDLPCACTPDCALADEMARELEAYPQLLVAPSDEHGAGLLWPALVAYVIVALAGLAFAGAAVLVARAVWEGR